MSDLPTLENFEWRLAVTAANDEVQAVGRCFVQLKLVLDGTPTFLEMTVTEFYELLTELERLKSKLELVELSHVA